jgi:hypothetical protein
MITTEYQLAVVPKIGKFVSVLQAVLSEFQPTISKNVSDIKMILWTRKSPLKYHTLTLGEFVSIFFKDFVVLITDYGRPMKPFPLISRTFWLGQINSGAFGVYSAKLSPPILVQ